MARQLKFRIWDRQSKTFVENAAGTHCASRWLIDAFTGRPVDFVIGFEDPEFGSLSEGENYYIEGVKVVKEPRYVVQQWTGLKDLNGKEIYEGDFVQDEDATYAMLVFYCNEIASFRMKYSQKGIYIGDFFGHKKQEFKIVGSMFENPELLK